MGVEPNFFPVYRDVLAVELQPNMCMGESKLMESLLAHKAHDTPKPNKAKRRFVDNSTSVVIIRKCGVIWKWCFFYENGGC